MRKNKCRVYDMGVGAYLKCVDTMGSRRQREREQMGVRAPTPGWATFIYITEFIRHK